MQLAASVLATLALFVLTLVFACVILLLGWLPFDRLYPFARAWACSCLAVFRCLCRLDYVVEGRENIPAGTHISFWKHSSTWETLAQAVIFPPQCWVLKREIMWIPFVGWATACLAPIAIDRGAGHRAVNQVVEQGRRRLEQGRWILIFPEGTRVAAGETRKYGLSGALLASRTGALLVPVAHNAGDFWPRRGLLKKAGTVRVVIGPPIRTLGRDPRAINAEAQAWIEGTMRRISATCRS